MRPEFDHVAYLISGLDNRTVGLTFMGCKLLKGRNWKTKLPEKGMSRFSSWTHQINKEWTTRSDPDLTHMHLYVRKWTHGSDSNLIRLTFRYERIWTTICSCYFGFLDYLSWARPIDSPAFHLKLCMLTGKGLARCQKAQPYVVLGQLMGPD